MADGCGPQTVPVVAAAASATATASKAAFVAPRNELENTLASIWAQALGHVRIGIDDNFFELGGHSLLSVRLVAEVRTGLGVELSIRDVFETSTLSELAQRVALGGAAERRPEVMRIERTGDRLPTSFAQQRLWFIDQLGGGSAQYNMPGALEIEGDFDESVAEKRCVGSSRVTSRCGRCT